MVDIFFNVPFKVEEVLQTKNKMTPHSKRCGETISMMTQHKNCKTISGETQNYWLFK
jgi:hypothetical protein